MTDKRIFRASEIGCNRTGWIVDLSPAGMVNPDSYWTFNTRKQADTFLADVDSGRSAREAANDITMERGRPPFYGQPMTKTALWLPADMLEWLKAQPGTMSENVRNLIRQAMER